jgi:hypothetical protein
MNADSLIRYDIRRTFRCPCGKGEYLYEAMDNDWGGRPKAEKLTMLCSDCKEKYVYDRRLIGGGRDGGSDRGWVAKENLKAEQEYRDALRAHQASILAEAERRCRPTWKKLLSACRTKKAVWEVAEAHQAYSTFLKHNRTKSLPTIIAELSVEPFYFYTIQHVLKICAVKESPEQLASVPKPEAPRSLPESLREMYERSGADTRQMIADAPASE